MEFSKLRRFSLNDVLLLTGVSILTTFSIQINLYINNNAVLTDYRFVVFSVISFFGGCVSLILRKRPENTNKFLDDIIFIVVFTLFVSILNLFYFSLVYGDRIFGFFKFAFHFFRYISPIIVLAAVLIIPFKKITRNISLSNKQNKYLISISIMLITTIGVYDSALFLDREYIPWKSDKLVSWSSFSGRSNYLTNNTAAICCSFDYELLNDSFDSIKVQAFMFSHHSYVKDYGGRDDESLIYLNYYFNISEVFARKFRESILKIPDSFLKEKIIRDMFLQYSWDMDQFLEEYSLETSKGSDLKKQIEWENKIDSLLIAYSEYASEVVCPSKLITSDRNQKEKYGSYMETDKITKLQVDYYKNGNKRSEVIMIDGKLEGKYSIWYVSGEIESEIEYHNGQRNGVVKEYYKSGQINAIMQYENGDYVYGSKMEWHKNGVLALKYENGELFEWDTDGSQIID